MEVQIQDLDSGVTLDLTLPASATLGNTKVCATSADSQDAIRRNRDFSGTFQVFSEGRELTNDGQRLTLVDEEINCAFLEGRPIVLKTKGIPATSVESLRPSVAQSPFRAPKTPTDSPGRSSRRETTTIIPKIVDKIQRFHEFETPEEKASAQRSSNAVPLPVATNPKTAAPTKLAPVPPSQPSINTPEIQRQNGAIPIKQQSPPAKAATAAIPTAVPTKAAPATVPLVSTPAPTKFTSAETELDAFLENLDNPPAALPNLDTLDDLERLMSGESSTLATIDNNVPAKSAIDDELDALLAAEDNIVNSSLSDLELAMIEELNYLTSASADPTPQSKPSTEIPPSKHFLVSLGFPQYADIFEEYGFDSLEHLDGLGRADLTSIGLPAQDADAILTAAAASKAGPKLSVTEQLAQLKEMEEQGMLSPEQHEIFKNRLLFEVTGTDSPGTRKTVVVPLDPLKVEQESKQLIQEIRSETSAHQLASEESSDLEAWLGQFEKDGQVMVSAERLLEELLHESHNPRSRISMVRSSTESRQLDEWLKQYETGHVPAVSGQQLLKETGNALASARHSVGLNTFDQMLANLDTSGDPDAILAELESAYKPTSKVVAPVPRPARSEGAQTPVLKAATPLSEFDSPASLSKASSESEGFNQLELALADVSLSEADKDFFELSYLPQVRHFDIGLPETYIPLKLISADGGSEGGIIIPVNPDKPLAQSLQLAARSLIALADLITETQPAYLSSKGTSEALDPTLPPAEIIELQDNLLSGVVPILTFSRPTNPNRVLPERLGLRATPPPPDPSIVAAAASASPDLSPARGWVPTKAAKTSRPQGGSFVRLNPDAVTTPVKASARAAAPPEQNALPGRSPTADTTGYFVVSDVQLERVVLELTLPTGGIFAQLVHGHTPIQDTLGLFLKQVREAGQSFPLDDAQYSLVIAESGLRLDPQKAILECPFDISLEFPDDKPKLAVKIVVTSQTELPSPQQLEQLVKHRAEEVDNPEIHIARRSFMASLKSISQEEITSVWARRSSDQLLSFLPTTFPLRVYLPKFHSMKTLMGTTGLTVSSLLPIVALKSKSAYDGSLEPNDYELRILGIGQFIDRNTPLGEFEYIRDILRRTRKLELVMVARSEIVRSKLVPTEQEIEFIKSSPEPPPSFSPREDIRSPISLRVVRVNKIDPSVLPVKTDLSSLHLTVEITAFYGDSVFVPFPSTSRVSYSPDPEWKERLRLSQTVADLPLSTRLSVVVMGRIGDQPIPLYWANIPLYDYRHCLIQGRRRIRLWSGAPQPFGSTSQCNNPNAACLTIDFMSFNKPVFFIPLNPTDPLVPGVTGPIPPPDIVKTIAALEEVDPFTRLSNESYQLLWDWRHYLPYMKRCRLLVKLVDALLYLSIPTELNTGLKNLLGIMKIWTFKEGGSTADAIELLNSRYASLPQVREFAVLVLDQLSDDDLEDYLLQLVQSLKAELHHPEYQERFGIYLEIYLRLTPPHAANLYKQDQVNQRLCAISDSIKDTPKNRDLMLRELLQSVPLAFPFSLPLQSTITCAKVIPEKCKVLDSAKKPLWLVFEHEDEAADPIYTIFKSGDDLRQDALTLQILRIMDRFWRAAGLDLCLTPYRALVSGNDMGMIEVVLNSATCSRIQAAGGVVAGAFKKDPLANWLREQVTGGRSGPQAETAYNAAVEIFMRSCAGYCVATYVLGIGDRHNSNIMMDRFGHLFHIDFGHFLGNTKTWAGMERERAPFVLTPDFVFVMGGKDSPLFAQFIKICCQAFNILRRNANIIINLFDMMISSGMPELSGKEDIMYIKDALALELNEDAADEEFTTLIYQSLNTKGTQINFAAHLIAHRKGMKEAYREAKKAADEKKAQLKENQRTLRKKGKQQLSVNEDNTTDRS